MIIAGKTYDIGKSLVQLWIPATSSAYFTLANIWDLPGAEKVVGTLAVLATFLGVTLKISSNNYYNSDKAYDGDMIVEADEDGSTIRLELNAEPSEIEEKDIVMFRKVNRPLQAEPEG